MICWKKEQMNRAETEQIYHMDRVSRVLMMK